MSEAPNNPSSTQSAGDALTAADRTRDLALAHIVERFADGEIRPEDLAAVERQVTAIPGGSEQIAFERGLRAACSRAMRDVPVPADAKDRVREAVRLRLLGEEQGANLALESLVATQGGKPKSKSLGIIGQLTVTRLAAAAALLIAGFLGAKLTVDSGENTATRTLSGGPAAGTGLDFSRKSLRAEYYAAAIAEATRDLGELPVLPTGDGIIPSRYSPAVVEHGRKSVRFEYAIRLDDGDGGHRAAMLAVIIQAVDVDAKFNPDVVVQKVDGDVYWLMRQSGPFIYNIQSDSKQAVAIASDSMGWPKPASRPVE